MVHFVQHHSERRVSAPESCFASGRSPRKSACALLIAVCLLTTGGAYGQSRSFKRSNEFDRRCQKNEPPIAAITSAPTALVGETIEFSGESSSDVDGSIQGYAWDFGDGGSGAGQSVSHVYQAAGAYSVTLVVTDDCDAASANVLIVTVTEPDPCANNMAPSADAGQDQSGPPGDEFFFNASGSSDPNHGPQQLTYQWTFGDGATGTGMSVAHVYAAEGTYAVGLTVTDPCGASDTATATVTVSGGGAEAIQADFNVYKLVGVNPDDGTEEWAEIDLENEEIELGLRLMFDASSSTGPVGSYIWLFMDGTFGDASSVAHKYNEPGVYNVSLTVYDPTWTESSTTSKPVHVGEGMHLLSTMPFENADFQVQYHTILGNEVWAVSAFGLVGVVDISDPYNLPPMEAMPGESVTDATGIASGNGRLYIARGYEGVDIYRAERDQYELLDHIAVGELGASAAYRVGTVGDMLYVATLSPDKLVTLDVSDPNRATLLDSLILPAGFTSMAQVGSEALLIHDGGALLTLIDIRERESPRVSAIVDSGVNLSSWISVFGHQVALACAGGTVLAEVSTPANLNEPIAISPGRFIEVGAPDFALRDGRFYRRTYYGIYKYFTGDPEQPPYLMQQAYPPIDCSGPMFWHDPDGPEGPQPLVLYGGISFGGLAAFAP